MRGGLIRVMVAVAALMAPRGAAGAASEARSPVPDAAARDRADKSVRDLFRSEFAARSPNERDALAKRLLETAAQTRDDPALRYALLEQALEVAGGVGDVRLSERAVERLIEDYEVKPQDLRLRALHQLRPSVRTPQAAYEFVDAALDTFEQALSQQDTPAATKALNEAQPVAASLRDAEVQGRIRAASGDLRDAQQEAHAEQVARRKLAADPNDADASVSLGRALCFYHRNWSDGLKMLARTHDPALREAVDREQAGPQGAEAQSAAGDAWWAVPERCGIPKRLSQRRAVYWYRRALSGLVGLKRVAVRQRIAEARASGAVREIESFTIEALIDGNSDLHITPSGIYWEERGVAKPGRHDGNNEPTYVNDRPWMPVWGKPKEDRGDDESEPLKMPIGDPDFDFTVLAIGNRRGERTLHRRTPVTMRDAKDEQILSIPDPDFGAQWYTIRLTRRKP